MTAVNQDLWITRIANADLSTSRYLAMKLVAGNKVDVVTAGATDQVIGFLQNKPASGKNATIAGGMSGGTCKAMANGAITEGTYVKVANTGKITQGGAGADVNWGIALDAAAADGDIIEIIPLLTRLTT